MRRSQLGLPSFLPRFLPPTATFSITAWENGPRRASLLWASTLKGSMHSVDQELLSQLVDEHSAALVLYARQLCHRPEDVVQEAFIRLMRQRPAPEQLVPWLYRVVRNEAISASRAAARRARHEKSASWDAPSWFQPSGDDAIDSRIAAEALETLPTEQREVIVLRIWGGQSFEEIAELIGKSTSTAHRRYEQGLTLLREKWSETCPNKNSSK